MIQSKDVRIIEDPKSRCPKSKCCAWIMTSVAIAAAINGSLSQAIARSLGYNPEEDKDFIQLYLCYPILAASYALLLQLWVDVNAISHRVCEHILSPIEPAVLLENTPVLSLEPISKHKNRCEFVSTRCFYYLVAIMSGLVPIITPLLDLMGTSITQAETQKLKISMLILAMGIGTMAGRLGHQNSHRKLGYTNINIKTPVSDNTEQATSSYHLLSPLRTA